LTTSSGDYIDLKAYQPAMRHLIDTYIRAEESEKISAFDDMSLIQLIVERGPDAVDARLKGIMKSGEAVAETIENNVRKLIINESPVDPAYYDKMSKLLDALTELRRKGAVSYKEYLEKIAKLTREAAMPGGGPGGYPEGVRTAAQRALYNNLDKNGELALAVDAAIKNNLQSDWKTSGMKIKKVRLAIRETLSQAASLPAAANRPIRTWLGMATRWRL
jgi:type I restriction enzyme R subunit